MLMIFKLGLRTHNVDRYASARTTYHYAADIRVLIDIYSL